MVWAVPGCTERQIAVVKDYVWLKWTELGCIGPHQAVLACTEGGYGGDGDDGGDAGDVTGVSKEGEDDTIAGQTTNKQQGDVRLFSQQMLEG